MTSENRITAHVVDSHDRAEQRWRDAHARYVGTLQSFDGDDRDWASKIAAASDELSRSHADLSAFENKDKRL